MQAIFLDMETTGLDPKKHSAIDIAFKIIDISSGQELVEFQQVIKHQSEVWSNRDLNSIEINGYTWEDLCQGESSSLIGEKIIDLFGQVGVQRGKSVFICQNPGFDRAFFSQLVDVYTQERLNWPYHWLDLASMYWGELVRKCRENQIPFPETLNLSKNEIAKNFSLLPETVPHRAMNGVNHLIKCYQSVLGCQFNS